MAVKSPVRTKVKLFEVVQELRRTSRNPEFEGFQNYIGFEHIEPNSLKVRNFGSLGDGVTFNKIFKREDVLFGKIRAYLRKVAVAPFDGICSGDILVLRTKDEELLSQKFLPYIFTTERFVKLAVDSSIGTTMPRTKWQHLGNYELTVPSYDEQIAIAEIFRAFDDSLSLMTFQRKRLFFLKNQILARLFGENPFFNPLLQADDFERVKFSQVASHISERVEPRDTNFQIYVGLEHLEPNSLRIEKKGTPSDVIGTKLKIYKGDIIFGKRRAYQRKLAVADFNGIVSAHSMVLRANEETIEKNLLPFLMQSDNFMNRAVQISEGSLSPTIKWRTLSAQEFFIPKRHKQGPIVDLLLSLEKAIADVQDFEQSTRNLRFKLLNRVIS